MRALLPIAMVALAAGIPGRAGADSSRIEDNSFLIEEAYNQEPGVLHHISTFQRSSLTGRWLFTYTEEWPVFGQDH